ncbi:hypothetical protein A0H81_02253 [Grifola frondosa]|uniref:Uncharacterized protein n=1 Tax=Grifola frondosa TaxID=5627 RepID=A0A1C7MLX8_GRIFR|nr:hypothetical protein A0H81_02253 [Grifola frondosa]
MRGIGSNVTVAPKMFLINRTAPDVLSLKPVPLMSNQLTTDVCVRLNDPADQSIISASPTVQFISFTTFLEDASPSHRYHCVVSDGKECMEVKLANKLGPLIERDIFVHTIAVVDGLERAEGGPVITSLRVVQKEAVKIGTPVSVEKLIIPAPTTPEDKKDTGVKDQSDQEELTKLRALLEQKQSSYQDVQRMLSEERAKRVDLQGLLEDEQTNHIKTQGLLKDERAKRISAESLLKDVQRESASPFVVPALADALKMISELTDAAGMGGQIED